MKVELKDLREGPLVMEVSSSPTELELQDDSFEFTAPVSGQIEFKLVTDRILARGHVSTRAETHCVRCLGAMNVLVSAPVDAVYENDDELLKPEKKAFGTDDKMITWFDGESITPGPELREALMLELPALPHCREDCKGLCPRCGANRNEEACQCDATGESASPWKAALKQINLE